MTEARIEQTKLGEDKIAGVGRILSTWRTFLSYPPYLPKDEERRGAKLRETGVDVKAFDASEAISESQESATRPQRSAPHGVTATGFCRWGVSAGDFICV